MRQWVSIDAFEMFFRFDSLAWPSTAMIGRNPIPF
jgi:hypothetical protein